MRHLVRRLDHVVTPDGFHAAFPGSAFVLEDDAAVMMGAEPSAIVRVHRADGGDPFAPLRTQLSSMSGGMPALDPAFPFPLRAGLVGYVGYEVGQMLERLPNLARPGLGLPDLHFGVHDWVLGTRDGASWLSVVADEPERVAERVLAKLAGGRHDSSEQTGPRRAPRHATAHLDRAAYEARVDACLEHILSGDAFEICLTNAFDVPFERADAWALFRALRRVSPTPFSAFLELPEGALVSSSPERFLSLDADRIAETRPIKGTRPRGATRAEDDALRRELTTSAKDRAENAMIVDLSRNDLGRVCSEVTVPELFAVESYATVHQLVSTVRGTLAPEHDAIDLLRACFPPGSMTGAPKIEAMTILERLEPVERGPYSGALGWLDVSGTMDLSVVIRTAVIVNGQARFAAGGAVTADSSAAAEYEEMLVKTRALRTGLEVVEPA